MRNDTSSITSPREGRTINNNRQEGGFMTNQLTKEDVLDVCLTINQVTRLLAEATTLLQTLKSFVEPSIAGTKHGSTSPYDRPD